MRLSIVICSYNRVKYLVDALKSLTSQTLPSKEFEIIMVNNNSNDNTEQVSLKFGQDNPTLKYKYVVETQQGLSYARNRGIDEAQGDIIAFVDDDAILEPNYADELLKAFDRNPDYESLGGKVLPIYAIGDEPKWMSKYIQGVVSKVDFGEKEGEFYKKKYPVGCNMAFRKEVFERIGGFNVDLTVRNDDKFMFVKVRQNGMKILYAPKVVLHHFMDAFRTEKPYLKKLCKEVGSTERVRLMKEENKETISKPFEYLFKLGASFILALLFAQQGQWPKAKYIILVRWWVLVGYFQKNN